MSYAGHALSRPRSALAPPYHPEVFSGHNLKVTPITLKSQWATFHNFQTGSPYALNQYKKVVIKIMLLCIRCTKLLKLATAHCSNWPLHIIAQTSHLPLCKWSHWTNYTQMLSHQLSTTQIDHWSLYYSMSSLHTLSLHCTTHEWISIKSS